MAKKRHSGTVVQGISFEPGILEDAKKRSKKLRRSLSAYVCDLIHADLNPITREATHAN